MARKRYLPMLAAGTLLVVACVCLATVLVVAGSGKAAIAPLGEVGLAPADFDVQARAAERLCIKRQFAQAERVYLGMTDQADSKQRFEIAARLASVLTAQEGNQPLAKTTMATILLDYSGHAQLPGVIRSIAEDCYAFGTADQIRLIYEQLLEEQPGRPDAIWLVMGQAIADTFAGDEDAAWANTEKLLNDYPNDSRAAEAVRQVAWACRRTNQWHSARAMYQHIVDTWPESGQAIYAQQGAIEMSLELRDSKAIAQDIEGFFVEFHASPSFAPVLYDIAEACRKRWAYEESRELHAYLIDNYPGSQNAIWSWQRILLCSVKLRDERAIDEAIIRLLEDFSTDEDIAEATYQAARSLNRRYDERARQLYEHVIETSTDRRLIMLARVGLGGVALRNADPGRAQAAFDTVLAEYQDDPALVEAANMMAHEYWEHALSMRSDGYTGITSNWPGATPRPGAAFWKNASDQERQAVLDEYRSYLHSALEMREIVVYQLPESDLQTAEACYFLAKAYERVGRLADAVGLYRKLVDRWPDYEYAWNAQYTVACDIEKMTAQKTMSVKQGAMEIEQACERTMQWYPHSMANKPAEILLKRWASTIRAMEEGEAQ